MSRVPMRRYDNVGEEPAPRCSMVIKAWPNPTVPDPTHTTEGEAVGPALQLGKDLRLPQLGLSNCRFRTKLWLERPLVLRQ